MIEDCCTQQPRLLERNLENCFFNQIRFSLQGLALCSDFFLDKGGIAVHCTEYVLLKSVQGELTNAK